MAILDIKKGLARRISAVSSSNNQHQVGRPAVTHKSTGDETHDMSYTKDEKSLKNT